MDEEVCALLRGKAAKLREAADLLDAAAATPPGDQRSEILDAASVAIGEAGDYATQAIRTSLGDIRREALMGQGQGSTRS